MKHARTEPAAPLVNAEPALRHARAATALMFFALGLGLGGWAAVIPAIRAALGLTEASLSLALLSFACGSIAVMPLAGFLVHRFDQRLLMRLAGCGFAVATVLPALAPSLPLLMAATAALGASGAVLDVAMNAQAGAIERAWGRPLMSSFHAAFSLGGLVGAAAMGGMLAVGGAATGMAAIGVACTALVGSAILTGGTVPAHVPDRGVGWPARLALGRALFGLGVLTLLDMLIEGASTDWSGVYLASVAGLDLAQSAAGYAAFALAMTAGRLVGDALVRRLGPVAALRLGAALILAGLALVLGVIRPVAIVAGFALIGLGIANMVPILLSAAGRRGGAAAIAVTATIGYSGFLLGPPLIGFAAQEAGLRLALLLLAPAAAIILLAAGILRPDRDAGAE